MYYWFSGDPCVLEERPPVFLRSVPLCPPFVQGWAARTTTAKELVVYQELGPLTAVRLSLEGRRLGSGVLV